MPSIVRKPLRAALWVAFTTRVLGCAALLHLVLSRLRRHITRR